VGRDPEELALLTVRLLGQVLLTLRLHPRRLGALLLGHEVAGCVCRQGLQLALPLAELPDAQAVGPGPREGGQKHAQRENQRVSQKERLDRQLDPRARLVPHSVRVSRPMTRKV